MEALLNRRELKSLESLHNDQFTGDLVWSSLYLPLLNPIKTLISTTSASTTTLMSTIREYVSSQPAYAQPMLRLISHRHPISAQDVMDAINETAWPLVSSKIQQGRHVTFLVKSMTSSGMLAILLFLHSLDASKQKQVIPRLLVKVVKKHTFPSDSGGSGNSEEYMVMDDAVYSGRTLCTFLRQIPQHVRRTTSIILPYTTHEALTAVKHLFFGHVHVGRMLATIYEDFNLPMVLMADAYYKDHTSKRTYSYAFDFLGLDDRHSIMLLAHKQSDMAMAPVKFLHTLPDAPTAPTVDMLKCASLTAAKVIVRLSGVDQLSGDVSRHAMLSSFVKDHVETLTAEGLMTPCTIEHKIVSPQHRLPSGKYAQTLAAFF